MVVLKLAPFSYLVVALLNTTLTRQESIDYNLELDIPANDNETGVDPNVQPYLSVSGGRKGVEHCNNTIPCRGNNTKCYLVGHRYTCKCKENHFPVEHENYTTCKPTEKKWKHFGSKEIYKVTMVAMASFIIAVLGMFVICVCNRSFFGRNISVCRCCSPNDDDPEDVFSVSDRLGRQQLENKPPTYDDVMRADEGGQGLPPPSYSRDFQPSATQECSG